jgi:hypothetical protein
MNMMSRLQKCPKAWKQGKVIMFPKHCNETKKDIFEN